MAYYLSNSCLVSVCLRKSFAPSIEVITIVNSGYKHFSSIFTKVNVWKKSHISLSLWDCNQSFNYTVLLYQRFNSDTRFVRWLWKSCLLAYEALAVALCCNENLRLRAVSDNCWSFGLRTGDHEQAIIFIPTHHHFQN